MTENTDAADDLAVDDLSTLEVGDKILFNDRKQPVTVTAAVEDMDSGTLAVEGPRGGTVEITAGEGVDYIRADTGAEATGFRRFVDPDAEQVEATAEAAVEDFSDYDDPEEYLAAVVDAGGDDSAVVSVAVRSIPDTDMRTRARVRLPGQAVSRSDRRQVYNQLRGAGFEISHRDADALFVHFSTAASKHFQAG